MAITLNLPFIITAGVGLFITSIGMIADTLFFLNAGSLGSATFSWHYMAVSIAGVADIAVNPCIITDATLSKTLRTGKLCTGGYVWLVFLLFYYIGQAAAVVISLIRHDKKLWVAISSLVSVFLGFFGVFLYFMVAVNAFSDFHSFIATTSVGFSLITVIIGLIVSAGSTIVYLLAYSKYSSTGGGYNY